MNYLKIDGVDYSHLVKTLTVSKAANYNSQVNAAGDTVIDYINSKKTVNVGFIPMSDSNMVSVLNALDRFNITLSYRDPRTNAIDSLNTIAPNTEIDYYTINVNGVLYNEFSVEFIEL
jgi:hypothetical protein